MKGKLLDRDASDVGFIETHGESSYLTETSVCQQDFEFWTDEVHLCLAVGRDYTAGLRFAFVSVVVDDTYASSWWDLQE